MSVEKFVESDKINIKEVIHLPSGDIEKRTTDSVFTIRGSVSKDYLMECQSTPDHRITVRIFEYAMQVALDESEMEGNTLRVKIPNCAVLFLRCNSNTPDKMYMKLEGPTKTFTVDVAVIKAQNYTLEALFEKRLLFLLPFYLFTYDKQLDEYNDDVVKLEQLKAEYALIASRLKAMDEAGDLSTYDHKVIVEMVDIVVGNLAKNQQNIVEGIKDVMGGRILNYEAKDILNRGIEQGRDEGKLSQAMETAETMHENGFTVDMIAKMVHYDLGTVASWLGLNPAQKSIEIA